MSGASVWKKTEPKPDIKSKHRQNYNPLEVALKRDWENCYESKRMTAVLVVRLLVTYRNYNLVRACKSLIRKYFTLEV